MLLLLSKAASQPVKEVGVDAEQFLSGLKPLERVTLVEAIDGVSLKLSDGRVLILSGLRAPNRPLHLSNDLPNEWPTEAAARIWLTKLTAGRSAMIYDHKSSYDRYGHLIGHVQLLPGKVKKESVWLQAALLINGWALVETQLDQRILADRMLRLEAKARQEQRGLWAQAYYQPLPAFDASSGIGGFRLIVGRILAAGTYYKVTYLNFGQDWRQDFTITMSGRARRRFLKAGLEPETWVGRRVQVRGWMVKRNGPMIVVTHPEQIEFLE